MTDPQITIGIDLDNTLVCYDQLFHLAAGEAKLIDPLLPAAKETIRDTIRRLPNGEELWTRLQATVYGPRMFSATVFAGAVDFLRRCANANFQTCVVSHKTPFALLDHHPVDLRKSASQWLAVNGLSSALTGGVFFESTRAEKIARIRALRCTHFIDDLPEVFAEKDFPGGTEKLLFAPHGASPAPPDVRVFQSWRDLERFFFP